MRHRIHLPKGAGATIALVLGLALVGYEAHSVYMCWQARQWLPTKGEVVKSYRTGRKSEEAHIEYEYFVEGKPFTASRVGFGGLLSPYIPFLLDSAGGIFRNYSQGSPVTVHYDPNDPARSVLEPEYRLSCFLGLGLGFLLTSSGMYSLLSRDKAESW